MQNMFKARYAMHRQITQLMKLGYMNTVIVLLYIRFQINEK